MNDEKRLDESTLEKVSGGGVGVQRIIDSRRIIAFPAATITPRTVTMGAA